MNGNLLFGFLLLGAATTALAEGISISTKNTMPLELSIPLSKKYNTTLQLWTAADRCHLSVAPFGSIDLQMPAPCDVQTLGASGYGFKPWVIYNETGDVPNRVMFRVVGALKYYPEHRAECGFPWRDVELTFPKGSGSPGEPKPTVRVMSPTENSPELDILRCPRFYQVENKLWLEVRR